MLFVGAARDLISSSESKTKEWAKQQIDDLEDGIKDAATKKWVKAQLDGLGAMIALVSLLCVFALPRNWNCRQLFPLLGCAAKQMETYGTLPVKVICHSRPLPVLLGGRGASADEEIKQCGSKSAVDKVEDDVLEHGSKLTLLEVNPTACERLQQASGLRFHTAVAVVQGKVSALESSQGSTSPRAAEGDGQAGGGGGGMDRQASASW